MKNSYLLQVPASISVLSSCKKNAPESNIIYTDVNPDTIFNIAGSVDHLALKYLTTLKNKYSESHISPQRIYPIPIQHSTNISFTLSQSQKVSAGIFKINGRLVKTIVITELQEPTLQLLCGHIFRH